MQNSDILIVLSPEEREATEKFIQQRLKTLDSERLPDIQNLISTAKIHLQRIRMDRNRYSDSPNRISKLMVKLHDSALIGLAELVNLSNQSATSAQKKLKDAQRTDTQGEDSNSKEKEEEVVDDLIIENDPEELKLALEYMEEKVTNLPLPNLRIFRDAYNDVLSWWESEKGQIESLCLEQYGNINTSRGRILVRHKREEIQKEILNPFKSFYRTLNIRYQRMSSEAATRAKRQSMQTE